MDNYIECCSYCGCVLITKHVKFTSCLDCHQHTYVYTSKKPKEYYINLSLQKHNTEDNWKEIFVEQELSQNPLFNQSKYEISCQKQKERDKRGAYKKAHPEEFKTHTPPIPKCPTCSSTNIKKISDLSKGVHALAFGLFSKTARSQFECKTCGYKW